MPDVAGFIAKWKSSGGAELANSQLFLDELCRLLGLPEPEPTHADEEHNVYTFEKHVEITDADGTVTNGRIDLYRKGAFVLESKQGSEQQEQERLARPDKKRHQRQGAAKRGTPGWARAMHRARQQAKVYIEHLPADHTPPPFLVVVDVGFCFDLYAEFTQTGKAYKPFPDPQNFRIRIDQLADEAVREKLRAVWLDPLSLDPTRRTARVTRELAARLAKLARSLEEQTRPDGAKRYTTELVSEFLMRCLFTMFAEDVELIKPQGFTELLRSLRDTPEQFKPMVEILWQNMNRGGFSPILREKVVEFNGGLFAECTALELNADQLELLIEASEADWSEVEPAIFGTLLERALDPVERHKLGAHYTPRAYVERLVQPTIMDPLEQEWESVQATAAHLEDDGKPAEAAAVIRDFHHRLCETKVLDPACGSGNFLYVALELMKRLEGEVINALIEYGQEEPLTTIDPHQFLGIEVNPRAAAITDLVLWIGYLQWHFRTRGTKKVRVPILEKFHNIECRDAVLAWDDVEFVTDDEGKPVTRWDGRTTRPHPVTGEEVPDETARVTERRYINPRKAKWPAVDFVVSNPPFIGNKRMRDDLGSGYVDAIRVAYPDVPGSVDYVMYWWEIAAELTKHRKIRRFGLITTNSITQTYSRQVLSEYLADRSAFHLAFAIPDHPWVDSSLGAAVRIAMTVGNVGFDAGRRLTVINEGSDDNSDGHVVVFREEHGEIGPDLRVGADVASVSPLKANERLCWQGCKLVGKHFQITPEQYSEFVEISPAFKRFLPEYWAGSDVTRTRTLRYVIDFFGLDREEATDVAKPLMQHLIDYVLPERSENRDRTFREKWWLFGRPRPDMREANRALRRYIITSEVAKHRTFIFVDWPKDLIDGSITAVAAEDAFVLGVLSSRIHVVWSLASGGRMGVGNDPRYQNARCFDPFPFPDPDEPTRQRIRELGEQLDAHRKRQQELHPDLTMTGMYNVLEKLRAGETLTKKEKTIHEHGLVSVLKQIHDDLDAAVADAYGWPHDLSDEDILQRLVDLNAQRAAEEDRGLIRWLRPEFQNPAGSDRKTQKTIPIPAQEKTAQKAKAKSAKIVKRPWPKAAQLTARFQALLAVLAQSPTPLTPTEVAQHFKGAKKTDVAALLETLAHLAQIRELDNHRYAI